jgi:hypothetical protein
VSQQISGALGLAVLSTIADTHTKRLLSTHHGLTSALISGYQLAFLLGAATIAGGTMLAYALLRSNEAQPKPQIATGPADTASSPIPAELEENRQAA